jgi:hypothetical protein
MAYNIIVPIDKIKTQDNYPIPASENDYMVKTFKKILERQGLIEPLRAIKNDDGTYTIVNSQDCDRFYAAKYLGWDTVNLAVKGDLPTFNDD